MRPLSPDGVSTTVPVGARDAAWGRGSSSRTRADRWRASGRAGCRAAAPDRRDRAGSGDRLPPWYSCGWGGIVSQASSVSSATTASMSPRSTRRGSAASNITLGRRLGSGAARGRAGRGVEGGARALQRAVDRGLAGVEHLGDLRGPEAEDVAQDQDRSLTRRERAAAPRRTRARWPRASRTARTGPGAWSGTPSSSASG